MNITIPPRLRLIAYLVLGAANVALVSWDPTFGHVALVDYGAKVVAGLSTLVLGVAASHVAKTLSADTAPEVTVVDTSPAAVVASSGMSASDLAATAASAQALAAEADVVPSTGSGQLDPVTAA